MPEVAVDDGKEQAARGREVEVWLVPPWEELERCGCCCTAALYSPKVGASPRGLFLPTKRPISRQR